MKRHKISTIREGGVETPSGILFDLSGGMLCLDFANTKKRRPKPKENLTDYRSLVGWSEQTGEIGPELAATLIDLSQYRIEESEIVLRNARELRESVFAIFGAVATRHAPPAKAVDALNANLPRALSQLRLVPSSQAYELKWNDDEALDRVLWPVVQSAADLLTSSELNRVRICAADNCDWLFFDQSKNQSRRWCDMSICGNRAKIRRFREAQRKS